MLEFKKKQKFRKILYSKFFILVLIVIFMFSVHSAYGAYQKVKDSREQLEIVEEQYKVLEDRKTAIEDKINKLDTNLGIEEEVRKKFNVVKEGEQAVILVDYEGEDVVDTEKDEEDGGFWNGLKSLFK